MPNEGNLGQHKFGGDHAHTEDHPPVFLSAPAKGKFEAGHVLASEGGFIVINDGTKPVVGVAPEDFDAGEGASMSYLAHGCAKGGMLKYADNTPITDFADITAAGIYPVGA
jgi:hypothetical protein